MGRKKRDIFGINIRSILSGGNRFSPIDLERSIEEGEAVYFEDRPFEERSGTYYRFDIGLSYRLIGKKVTHAFLLDIQNVTNRQNVYVQYYDEGDEQIETFYQTGLLPVFNYRIEF